MTKARDANLAKLVYVAERLGPLLHKVVFAGGCATGLLVTDEAVPDVRATVDVDMIVNVISRVDYHKIEKKLAELGFSQSIEDDTLIICRWYIDDIKVDVMPTDESILGFINRWYSDAIKTAQEIQLGDNLRIKLLTAPYFLATKLEAFRGRGQGDYLASHDMEDIITIIDGRPELIDEIRTSSHALRKYLATEFTKEMESDDFREAIPGHLLPDESSQARLAIIIQRLEQIAQC
jgi:hypothetical protein